MDNNTFMSIDSEHYEDINSENLNISIDSNFMNINYIYDIYDEWNNNVNEEEICLCFNKDRIEEKSLIDYEFGYKTNLFIAFKLNHITCFQKLINKNECLEEVCSKDGSSILHIIATYGNKKYIEKILEKNVDVNILNYIGNSPLFYAIQNNNYECIALLKNNGAKCIYNNKEIII